MSKHLIRKVFLDNESLKNDIKLIKQKLGLSTTPKITTELGSDLVLSNGEVKEIKGNLKFNGHKIRFNGGKIKFV